MGVWGLCRKSKCPRPPVTHLPLSCSFGRGRGRGGRATAKPTVSRRTSADGFAIKMKRTKAGGRIVKSCSPFSAAKWQRQKSRQSRGQSGDFLRSKKYYSALTVWIGGTDMIADCLRRKNLLYLGKQIKRKFLRKHNSVKKFLKWKERSIK